MYGYCGGLNSIIVSETLALNQVGRVFGFFPDQVASFFTNETYIVLDLLSLKKKNHYKMLVYGHRKPT